MSFSVVIFPAESGYEGFVAMCIEKYIAVQGKSLEDCHYEMECVLATHVALDLENGQEPLENIPSSPRKFRKAFMDAETDLGFGPLSFHFGAANDTEVSKSATEITSGPRHYRYTDKRPPEDYPWMWI